MNFGGSGNSSNYQMLAIIFRFYQQNNEHDYFIQRLRNAVMTIERQTADSSSSASYLRGQQTPSNLRHSYTSLQQYPRDEMANTNLRGGDASGG